MLLGLGISQTVSGAGKDALWKNIHRITNIWRIAKRKRVGGIRTHSRGVEQAWAVGGILGRYCVLLIKIRIMQDQKRKMTGIRNFR